MDRILFGDNQFFGVNHMSEEKARAQAMRFSSTQSMMDVLDTALDLGIKTFMCTTHDGIAAICDHVRADPNKYRDFEFYPCMPYAYKYADAMIEHGVTGALKKFVQGDIFSMMLRGSKALVTRNFTDLILLLVDAEMKMFRGLKTDVIFIQNITVDLMLGLGLKEPFIVFAEHIKNKYGAEPGFQTMNLPLLLNMLESCEIENPIICSVINKTGFRMCGGLKTYEELLRVKQFRPIAMSIFASGAIPPKEAIEYICRIKEIESIVFGASTYAHIKQTKELIEQFSS
jgi:hypothetical protein